MIKPFTINVPLLNQFRELLNANNVPKPHILWLNGLGLLRVLKLLGREPWERDGPILHSEQYRYNLDTNRFRVALPPRPHHLQKVAPHVINSISDRYTF